LRFDVFREKVTSGNFRAGPEKEPDETQRLFFVNSQYVSGQKREQKKKGKTIKKRAPRVRSGKNEVFYLVSSSERKIHPLKP
jgi:hypothetical protein